jgi:DNA adenine methylase
MSEIEVPTFIKWAGGKKKLLSQFEPLFPQKIERFFDPFVGGGSVAFFIIKKYKPKKVFLSDINEELINCYNVIKNDVDNLITELNKLKSMHNKENYYKTRSEDPTLLSPVKRAARFIYLNKTCYNGLYRVNSKGQFNVPMGEYKNPSIYSENDLREISQLLKNTRIKIMHFSKIRKNVRKDDFVYFDPPYYPLKKGKSFTTYTKDNFLEKDQIKLAKLFSQLHNKGSRLMLSNSDTDFIKNLYKKYNIHTVNAPRMINCDATKRGIIKEVLVTN